MTWRKEELLEWRRSKLIRFRFARLQLIHQIKHICCVGDFSFNTPSSQKLFIVHFHHPPFSPLSFFPRRNWFIWRKIVWIAPNQFNSSLRWNTANIALFLLPFQGNKLSEAFFLLCVINKYLVGLTGFSRGFLKIPEIANCSQMQIHVRWLNRKLFAGEIVAKSLTIIDSEGNERILLLFVVSASRNHISPFLFSIHSVELQFQIHLHEMKRKKTYGRCNCLREIVDAAKKSENIGEIYA